MKMFSSRTSRDTSQLDRTYDEIFKHKDAFIDAMQRYAPLIDSPQERTLLSDLDQAYQQYMAHAETVYQLLSEDNGEAARELAWGDMALLAEALVQHLDALSQLNDETKVAASTQAHATYQHARAITLSIMALAVLLTLLLAWRLTHSLAGPPRR